MRLDKDLGSEPDGATMLAKQLPDCPYSINEASRQPTPTNIIDTRESKE